MSKVNGKRMVLLRQHIQEDEGEVDIQKTYEHAEVLMAVGMLHEAKKVLEHLLRVDPDHWEARHVFDGIEALLH